MMITPRKCSAYATHRVVKTKSNTISQSWPTPNAIGYNRVFVKHFVLYTYVYMFDGGVAHMNV